MTLISDLMKRLFNKSCKFLEEQVEKVRGNVIIQTYQPQHPVIKFCKDYKLKSFTIGKLI